MQARAAVPMSGAPKHRPVQWWHTVLTSLLLWTLFGAIAAAANYRDVLHFGGKGALWAMLQRFWLLYLPLALLSAATLIAFERTARVPRASTIYLSLLALLAGGLPLYALYHLAILRLLSHKPVEHLLAAMFAQRGWTWWLDGLMLATAYAAPVALTMWWRGQHQALASQAAQRDNLALRLALLQGQLEPYFLLSSLDGIGALVRNAERPLATRALARLSDLLRYALRSSQQEWLSVADEIGFVRDYLDLQMLRPGARLQVQWELEPIDWSEHRCPPLLLHPLVEYALAQGQRSAPAGWTLRLSVALQDACVHVTLEHPGHPDLAGGADAAPALTASHERLALLFGGAGQLDRRPGAHGMCVSLRFPALEHADD